MKNILCCAGLFSVILLNAQPIDLIPVASGFTNPTDIDNAGDDRLFVVERAGLIRILRPDGTIDPQPFLDITTQVNSSASEQGLLGITFHPNYTINGYFYVNYVHGSENGTTRISRFTVSTDPDVADPASEFIVWSTPQLGLNHNGGGLAFGPDGNLWIPLGDGGPDWTAQDMTTPLGKMLRINVDGSQPYSIPSDNPYATGDPTATLPEIWASGLRNPFRFSFDALTGDIWIADVGQSAYEEVNFWPAGDHSGPNFGWRCYEGPAPYNTTDCAGAAAYVDPIHYHSHTDGSCSVIGGYVYRGGSHPDLYGKYIYTDFCHGRIHSLAPDGNGGWIAAQHTDNQGMGFASFGLDMNGELLVVNTINGQVSRVTSAIAPEMVQLDLKLFLEGPLDPTNGLMHDLLRTNGLLPLEEPYTAMGKVQVAGGGGETTTSTVLSATGNAAVVDWVRVELRDAVDPSQVVATRQGLLLRNGDVVMADGSTPIGFNASEGEYHVVVDHRNHLPVASAAPVQLSSTPVALDLRSPSTLVHGTEARKPMGSWVALWAGDPTGDGTIKYTGANNDRDHVLVAVGGISPTNTVEGYYVADVNMDGIVRYTGANNDRDMILVNIGGVVPTNTKAQQMPW